MFPRTLVGVCLSQNIRLLFVACSGQMFGRGRMDDLVSRVGAVEDAFNMYAPRLAGVEFR